MTRITIKWIGIPKYRGISKKAYAPSMMELYFKLVEDGIISEIDYDPILKFCCKRQGADYDSLYSEFVNEETENDGWLDEFLWFEEKGVDTELSNREWYDLIVEETYYTYETEIRAWVNR